VAQLAVQPRVPLAPCEEDPAFLCGTLDVPFDRARPRGRTIAVAFMVRPHTNPDSTATDAILGIDGGPGESATGERYFFEFRAGPQLEDRDLLLVDSRGTGLSEPVYCPTLQDKPFDPDTFVADVAACGRALGRDADRYGSGDIALDIEAVRRALGYDRLSIDAISYGTVHAQAYAYRFPHRTKAMVLDAGMPVSDRDHEWTWGRRLVRGTERVVALGCKRAPTCADLNPDYARTVDQLARLARRDPFTGRASGLDGASYRVRVDERMVVDLVRQDPAVIGELTAAADAWQQGDRRPILRLAAEYGGFEFEPTDLRDRSEGMSVAAQCSDLDFVWKRTDPVPVRLAKLRRALRELGPRPFAPFSTRAWVDQFGSLICLRWPAPDRFVPAVPSGATITGVPTLVLSGDIDGVVPTETNRALLEVVPDARLVVFAGAAHPVVRWSECSYLVMNDFLGGEPLDLSCAKDPAFVPPTMAEFPRRASLARPATSTAGNEATRADRKVVRVAVDAARDAWMRSFRTPDLTGTVAGLRGGTVAYDYGFDDRAEVSLHGVRFTRDVVVRGGSTLLFEPNTVRMELVVRGPTGRAVLSAEGTFGYGEPYGDFTVTGRIGGRDVAARVPAI
jgi:pimeloyl-ACP methyl ester carboxylesterase